MVGEFFMMTLQQIDMSILLWIQEHLRADALTPFWKVIRQIPNMAQIKPATMLFFILSPSKKKWAMIPVKIGATDTITLTLEA